MLCARLTFLCMDNHKAISCVVDALVACRQAGAEMPALDDLAELAGVGSVGAGAEFSAQFLDYTGYDIARYWQMLGFERIAEYGGSAEFRPFLREKSKDIVVLADSLADLKARKEALVVRYGGMPSPYGDLIVAKTHKGVCFIGFKMQQDIAWCLARMFELWGQDACVYDQESIAYEASCIARLIEGEPLDKPLCLHVFGTEFQQKVWEVLLRIPVGGFASYKDVAGALGAKAGAARAVGGAVGANPISVLIACHRVVQAGGKLNNYGWGSARKKALLGVEYGRVYNKTKAGL